jgi:hypothetical protein
MKYIWKITLLLLITLACETSAESSTAISSKGIFVLNQGNGQTGSSITRLPLDGTETEHNVFLRRNGKSLGTYANHLFESEKYVFVVIPGSGSDGKIRILNKSFIEITTIDAPSGLSPQFGAVLGNQLLIQYANWTSYDHKLYSYDLSDINNLSSQVVGSINGLGHMKKRGEKAYFVSGKTLYSIQSNTGIPQINTTTYTQSLNDVEVLNGNVYLGFTQYSYTGTYGTTGYSRSAEGGILIQGNTLETITLSTGVAKLSTDGSTLYYVAKSGTETGTYYSDWDFYSWEANEISVSLNSLVGTTSQTLFTNNKLNIISTGDWIQFTTNRNQFIVPDYANYSNNGSVKVYATNGQEISSHVVGVGPCQFILVD